MAYLKRIKVLITTGTNNNRLLAEERLSVAGIAGTARANVRFWPIAVGTLLGPLFAAEQRINPGDG
jgi:hypothetical protein